LAICRSANKIHLSSGVAYFSRFGLLYNYRTNTNKTRSSPSTRGPFAHPEEGVQEDESEQESEEEDDISRHNGNAGVPATHVMLLSRTLLRLSQDSEAAG